MPIRPGFSRANRRSFSSAPGAYTSSSSMNARCDPRARGIAFMRAVSPASPESSHSTSTSSPGCTCREMLRSVRSSVFRPRVATMIDSVGSAIEVRARPELEVQRPPELHARSQASRPVALKTAPSSRSVDDAALAQGLRGKDVACQGTERPSQPVCLRRDEAELAAPLPHLRRQQIAEGAAQDRLRLAAADQLVRREREAQLDEAMVEERHPRLQRVGHRVPILVAKELGKAASREDELLVTA